MSTNTVPVAAHDDMAQGIRNAFKLGLSLVVTWGVALGVRIFLPRHLGPQAFGGYTFADVFTTSCFVLMSLGIDTYVRKEVPLRPHHASDFFGGVVLLRLALSAFIVLGMYVVLRIDGKSEDTLRLVLIFSGAEMFVVLNNTLSAMLHAVGKVDGLSIISVVTKLVWGGGSLALLVLGWGAPGVAFAYLTAEAIKAISLFTLSTRHVHLQFRIDFRTASQLVVISLPYYLNYLTHMLYSKIDVTLLSFLTNDAEVGYYGAALNLAGLALLVTPLVGWVLMPMMTRAGARSEDELTALMRRSVELILMVAIPAALILGVAADFWILRLFGNEYAPAIASLRYLAPMFIFTYVAMVSATFLIRIDRGWTVTLISVVGLLFSPLMSYALIRHGLRTQVIGAPGKGAAQAVLLTEFLVTSLLFLAAGARAFDLRTINTMLKATIACIVTFAVDRLLHDKGLLRIFGDAFVYSAIVLITRAVRPEEMTAFVKMALKQKG